MSKLSLSCWMDGIAVGGLLKLWWLWAGAGLGAVAVGVVVLQPQAPSEPPETGVESQEITETEPRIRPEPEISPAPDLTVVAPVPSREPSAEAVEIEIVEDKSAEAEAPPVSADPASAPLVAPAIDADSPDGLILPEIGSQEAGILAQNSGAGFLGGGQPLSLAQILPPGDAPRPDQIAPSFDLVRVARDGSAVIAGRAEPGAQVQIFSGGLPVGEAQASARGEFVIFLDNPELDSADIIIPERPAEVDVVFSQEDIVILPPQPNSPESAAIVVRRTPDAVQILQPAGPSIPDQISLDLVTYSQSGAVVLAGRGQPGAAARIYANGRFSGEAIIASGGDWRLEVEDIAEGRYILRVDEVGAEGAVLSRTESPFQREFPASDMPESFSQGAKIIVQPGNTLWLMAAEAYGNGDAYTQIFSANAEAIRDPDLIYPGQIISIPKAEE